MTVKKMSASENAKTTQNTADTQAVLQEQLTPDRKDVSEEQKISGTESFSEKGVSGGEEDPVAAECRGVVFSYRKKEVLRGADLSVQRGKITALLGRNGSGKTTLMRCMAGVRKPASGGIWLEGERLDGLSPRERAKRVAMMPQLLPPLHRTVAELVAMGRYPYLGMGGRLSGEDRKIVLRAVRDAEMEGHLEDAVCALSGGERQMAYFAMALAQDTKLVLLDEPTSNLDPEYRRRVFALMKRLCGEGYTFLVTLHDLEEAAEFADRIAVLDGGKTVFFGTAEEFARSGVAEKVFGVVPVCALTQGGETITVFRPN